MLADKPYSVWETILYGFLNSFPYMVLVLIAFRQRWRYSKQTTFLLLLTVTLLVTAGTALRLLSASPSNPLFDLVFSLLYIVFVFLAVREPVGKLVFAVLVLMDLGNLVIVSSKCLEGLFFGDLAIIRYHWTYSLMMLPVLGLLLPAIYLAVFRRICSEEEDSPAYNSEASEYMWRYLWLIPAVFYLIWLQHFYVSGRTALENALDPLSTAYLFLIDAGSVFIYRIVTQLVTLQTNNQRLKWENHMLSVQNIQYENLQKRMDETRQARHDLRHHIILLKSIRDNRDFTALDQLLEKYPDMEIPLQYCQNETANAVLVYFGNQAAAANILYSVNLEIPENIFIDKPDLAVLLSNLLENALEACRHVEKNAFVNVSGKVKGTQSCNDSLAIIIENSCIAEPHVGKDGTFRSTKHRGNGIGIESVRSIVRRYDGASSFIYKDGVFTASVLINQAPAGS